MGGNSNANAVSNAQNLVDMLTAKTARELGLDMGVSGANRTTKAPVAPTDAKKK
jgi:hypothetical protein